MKKKIACLLALVLALLPVVSLAEEPPAEGDAPVQAEQADTEALDLAIDLDQLLEADGADLPEVSAGEATEGDTTQAETPQEEGAQEASTQGLSQTEESAPEDTPQAEVQPEETSQQETPSYFGDPIGTKTIKVTKTASKTVYLGIPYVLNVTGNIKKTSSSAKKIATVAKHGTVTLKKKGTAKITITRKKGSKIKLTLKVKAVPGQREDHGFLRQVYAEVGRRQVCHRLPGPVFRRRQELEGPQRPRLLRPLRRRHRGGERHHLVPRDGDPGR